MRREKKKKGERKQRNFGNTVTEIPLPKMRPSQLKKSNCGNVIAEKGKKKKFCFGNCGNAIADNVKKKKFILTIVAIPLLKMEKKNYEICE